MELSDRASKALQDAYEEYKSRRKRHIPDDEARKFPQSLNEDTFIASLFGLTDELERAGLVVVEENLCILKDKGLLFCKEKEAYEKSLDQAINASRDAKISLCISVASLLISFASLLVSIFH